MAAELFSFASVETPPLCGLSHLRASSVSRRRVSSKFPALWIRISCSKTQSRSISCRLSEPTPVWAPSDSSASSSSGPDFGLVSTSVCSDGSMVFHFGDVIETARPGIEETEVTRYEVASEGLPNEDPIDISALEEVPDKDKGETSEVADIIGPEVPDVNTHEENIELVEVIDKGKEESKVTSRKSDEVAAAKSFFSEDKLELSNEDINRVLALEEAQDQEKGTTITSSISEVVADVLDENHREEVTAHVDDSNHTAELEEVADNGSTSVDDSDSNHVLGAVATELLDSPLGLEATSQSPEPSTPVSVSSSTVLEVGFVLGAEGSSSLEETLQERTTPLEGDLNATSNGPEMAASEEEEVLQAKAVDEIEPINLEELSQSETPDEGVTTTAKMEEISQEKAFGDENISVESTAENVTEVLDEYCEEPEVLHAYTSAEAVPSGDEQVRDNTMAATLEMDTTKAPSTLDNGVVSNQDSAEDVEESNDIAEELVSSILQSQSGNVIPERAEIVLMSEFSLSSGAASLPHPSKALTGGEDGYFIAGKNWVGVADGARHWSLEGTNDGLFAKELMKNIKAILSDSKSSLVTDPVDVLVRSAAETASIGTSTVLVAHLDGQVLNVANIGDSGFIIIRNGMVLNRSVPLVHGFNFPVQIGKGDDPSELVECYRIELDENDVIVSATDGLFDNLYDEEIASIVHKSLQVGMSPQEIAEVIVTRAEEAARSESGPSPFADSAYMAGYVGFLGGKLDDITVIVSVVDD